jgi:hypothetical protein
MEECHDFLGAFWRSSIRSQRQGGMALRGHGRGQGGTSAGGGMAVGEGSGGDSPGDVVPGSVEVAHHVDSGASTSPMEVSTIQAASGVVTLPAATVEAGLWTAIFHIF